MFRDDPSPTWDFLAGAANGLGCVAIGSLLLLLTLSILGTCAQIVGGI